MEIFEHHRLIKNQDGYTVILYLNRHPGEFSTEFLTSIGSKRRSIRSDSSFAIKGYLDKNLPDIKINAVKVMIGSVLVAAIPFSSVINASERNISSATSQSNKTPSAAVSAALKTQKTKKTSLAATTQKSIIVANPTSISTVINKTRHLSSTYVPRSLVVPNIPFPFKEYHPKKTMRQDAARALEELFAQARKDNIKLYGISGYRSYHSQKSIFTANTKKYGSSAAANRVSAKPGESEHQSGLAIDVSSPSVNFELTEAFGNTKEGKWLKENAPKYGFIIRYPKGKESITGYQYEPWHIRYVGKDAAMAISRQNTTLEQYMGLH